MELNIEGLKEIYKYFKSLRELNEISQRTLSEHIKFSNTEISKIEKETYSQRQENKNKIKKFFKK